MPKSIPAQVITQMDAQQKAPCLLFELGLSSTIRFAAYMTDVTFPTAGNTYTAKKIKVSGMNQSLEGQIGRVTVSFDNVSKDMAAYAANEDFRGKTLVIKRVYLDAVGDASYYNEVFNGTMEIPSSITRHMLTVSATNGESLNKNLLKFPYQRTCPWIYGDDECNSDGLANPAIGVFGTADSGSTTTLVDNALTQAEDFWAYGRIEITKAGITYHRTVRGFAAASDTVSWDVALPVAVDNTTTYVMYKGCSKTWDACQSNQAWGPSGDNKLNFGGCLHITDPTIGYGGGGGGGDDLAPSGPWIS